LDSFAGIANVIRDHSVEEIIACVSGNFNMDGNTLANRPMGGYSKGRTSGAYYFVLKDFKNNLPHYEWLYRRLEDTVSVDVFTNLMRYRLLPSNDFIEHAYDATNPQYFDKSIIHTDDKEVFVDCGAYIGDTIQSYIEHCGGYGKIIAYEPSAENIKQCAKMAERYPNIFVRRGGVGSTAAQMAFNDSASSSGFSGRGGNSAQATDTVDVFSLDEDIKEPVTFIKMDIEGSETDAIYGATAHIRNESPKLAICLYHIVSDIWEIPRLTDAINPNYKFYVRHYHKTQNWETVLYAVPKDDLTDAKTIQKTTRSSHTAKSKKPRRK
jgi:FkbM family methyltransferase